MGESRKSIVPPAIRRFLIVDFIDTSFTLNVRQLPIIFCAKSTRKFFIVFLCELCAFARDLYGSDLPGLGVQSFSLKDVCISIIRVSGPDFRRICHR